MKRSGEVLRAALCVSVLFANAGIAAVVPAAAATAANFNVTVTNTPLPVKGTVNVGNFPATQPISGSVSITGTPSVNVGNTPSNPVPTLDASKVSTNIVEIVANASSTMAASAFFFQGPDGNVTPFTTLPADKALVITSVEILALHGTAPLVNVAFGPMQLGGIPSPRTWVVPGTQTTSFSWPTGFVIGAGRTLAIISFGDDSVVRFRGYFVSR